MAINPECMNLLKMIQQVEFVALELQLYLDTHPDEAVPLQHFNQAAAQLAALKKQYEDRYGPLLSYGFSPETGNTWRWAQTPWPWEM